MTGTRTRTSLVLGATGLVGAALLQLLAEDPVYAAVTALLRRTSRTSLPKVREVVIDFERPDEYRSHLGVDDIFCCLGTTIKQAGSEAAFRKVDYEIPVAIARAALLAGAKRYVIVTAVGASAGSRIFYNRVKGETEDALRALAFPEGIHILHPSILLGNRAEPRPGEKVASALMSTTRPLFVGYLARYRAIDAADVARAMKNAATAGKDGPGVHVYEGKTLFALAGRS